MKIAEANAPTEIAQIPLIIENIMENSFLVTINTWTTKIYEAIDRSVRQWLTHNALKQSLTDCVLRVTSRVALAIYTRERRLSRTPSDQNPQRQ
jgi:hypothetical protein